MKVSKYVVIEKGGMWVINKVLLLTITGKMYINVYPLVSGELTNNMELRRIKDNYLKGIAWYSFFHDGFHYCNSNSPFKEILINKEKYMKYIL